MCWIQFTPTNERKRLWKVQNWWDEYRGVFTCPANAFLLTAWLVWSLLHPDSGEPQHQPSAILGCCRFPRMSEPRVSLVTLSLWLQEKVLWLSAPVQPMSVLSLLTWDVSGLTVQKPCKRAQIVDCWCFLMPLLAYLVKGTSTYCTWR